MSKLVDGYLRRHGVTFELTIAQMEKLKPLHDAVEVEYARTAPAGAVIVQLHNEGHGKAMYFPRKYSLRIQAVAYKCLTEMAKAEKKK
jgi:hypothetical protein